MTYFFGLFLFALLTSGCSALHGTDKLPRGVAIAVHAITSVACGWFAPICVAIYWCFLRTGEQAVSELDYLGKDVAHLKTGGNLGKIRKAYDKYFEYALIPTMRYVQNHPWPYTKDQPSRVQQEFSGSYVKGILLFVPVSAVWFATWAMIGWGAA